MTPEELKILEEVKIAQRATFNLLAEVMERVSRRAVNSVFVLQDNVLHEFKGETSLISLRDAPNFSDQPQP